MELTVEKEARLRREARKILGRAGLALLLAVITVFVQFGLGRVLLSTFFYSAPDFDAELSPVSFTSGDGVTLCFSHDGVWFTTYWRVYAQTEEGLYYIGSISSDEDRYFTPDQCTVNFAGDRVEIVYTHSGIETTLPLSDGFPSVLHRDRLARLSRFFEAAHGAAMIALIPFWLAEASTVTHPVATWMIRVAAVLILAGIYYYLINIKQKRPAQRTVKKAVPAAVAAVYLVLAGLLCYGGTTSLVGAFSGEATQHLDTIPWALFFIAYLPAQLGAALGGYLCARYFLDKDRARTAACNVFFGALSGLSAALGLLAILNAFGVILPGNEWFFGALWIAWFTALIASAVARKRAERERNAV